VEAYRKLNSSSRLRVLPQELRGAYRVKNTTWRRPECRE